MRFVKHQKSKRYYLELFKVLNATNNNDGQIMKLYFGKYHNKFKFGFFVREINEFRKKFS